MTRFRKCGAKVTAMGAEISGYGVEVKESHETKSTVTPVNEEVAQHAVKSMSAVRILFGSIFLFDGILKWILFQQGTMQATVQGFGYAFLSNNWVAVGALVGLGETIGGILLIAGIFQRPAAVWCATIMFGIWAVAGFDGAYVQGSGWNFVGYTDPGGDLMLALVFVALVFAPYAYGLASRYHLRGRFSGPSVKDKVMRFLIC